MSIYDEPLPDEDIRRKKLMQYSKEDLIDMLFISYKNTRAAAKMADEESNKRDDLKKFLEEVLRVF